MRATFLAALAVLPVLACDRGRGMSSPDPLERVAALQSAGKRGAEGTAMLLVAQRDPDVRVRRAAAEALADREGPAAVDALANSLADPDPQVVTIAARGLAARPWLPRSRDALVAAYAGSSPIGREAIADALEALGTSLRTAVELEARLLWERNVAVLSAAGPARAGAAEELGASARAEAVSRLLPLVDPNRNPDRVLAAAAVRGLGEAGDRSARRPLELLLEEPDADLSEAAAEALGRLGDPAAADALAAAAIQGASRTAPAAAEALASLPEAPEVASAVCEVALRSNDPA
ncbi:MAG TPA: HEAT repeat domain-containing protein, partial [Anaeromyxobacter sp.]|nr:HEAT repeat domain-containing protein [Anaeromyxobacter sp.]